MTFKDSSTLSDRIKDLRKQKGLTQLQLAEKLNITDKAVSKWESGDGNPDISILPSLADILNCTIDYLLTGKTPEEKIVFMSKIEYCAKNDDPSILGKITFSDASKKDETGTSFFSYIRKYKSFKVFKEMLNSCSHPSEYLKILNNTLDGELFVWLIKCNKEREIVKQFNSSNEIRLITDLNCPLFPNGTHYTNNNAPISNDFDIIFTHLVKNFDSLTEEQKEYYFNLNGKGLLKIKDCWFAAYPYFIDYSYKLNKKLYKNLLERIPTKKEWDDAINEVIKNSYDHSKYGFIQEYGFVHILRHTFDNAIDNKDYDNAKIMNNYLSKPLDDYEFNKEIIIKDTTMDKNDMLLKLINRNGVIVLDILYKLKDIKKITEILENGFITYREYLLSLFDKRQYKDLYKIFVDLDLTSYANKIIDGKIDELQNNLIKSFPEKLKKIDLFNLKELIEAFKGVHPEKSFTSSYCSRNKDCSFVYGEENEYKKFILDELNAKLERNKLIESYNKSTVDITEDYIFNLIKSGNAELAVIKLCSKLEAVFVTKYNLNGDLFTMMDNWRKIYGVENDDCGYGVESEKAKLLQKLRRYRNSIAHPNESAEKLSYDEFEKIVRIVFTL